MSGILLNPVLLAVVVLLLLSALRVNVVFSILIATLAGGFIGHLNGTEIIAAFGNGMKDGAGIAFNYAMLGAFSIAISRSGITELLAKWLGSMVDKEISEKQLRSFKYILLFVLTLISISSQNLIPIHIAFIPVVIPPLLTLFNRLQLDRRAVACVLTFGLITPYMVLPFGFGKVYLEEVLVKNLENNNLQVAAGMPSRAMVIPALGMVAGLLIALFFSYRRPRTYQMVETDNENKTANLHLSKRDVIAGVIAIVVGLAVQIWSDSLMLSSLGAVMIFVLSGVISLKETQDVFTKGVYLMGGIGIVMIAAHGFAEVLKVTGGVESLVKFTANTVGNYRGIAIFIMLFVGLLITMGIGSSFSTVPLIAAIYVPLCMQMGISTMATVAIVGVAGALGDAGSPVSESVLGPTAGLNADGQHDHIYDSTIPTFLHFNLPLLIAGWIAGMIL